MAVGCEQSAEVRIYEGPKSDTVFVAGPNATAGTAASVGGTRPTAPSSGPRRILGAVIPTESGCYFLKTTDAPERLEPLLSDFRDIVSEFAIDTSTGKPNMALPEGWVMNPRNDIAMAEFVSPASSGSVKFTVTMLAMPAPPDWEGYLLSNINRWRGQLSLPETTANALNDELMSVARPSGLLPGYIFDATGNGSGGMSGSPASGNSVSPVNPPSTAKPAARDNQPTATGSTGANESKKPQLKYELPEGWESVAGTPFRLATFAISSSEGMGEVTVSMAVDNPVDNTMMWYQQISRETDPEKVKSMAESTVANTEKISSALGDGVLYTIRDSEQVDAPMLLVASLPSQRDGLHVFVKLRGEAKLAEAQRRNLQKFVQTLQLQ